MKAPFRPTGSPYSSESYHLTFFFLRKCKRYILNQLSEKTRKTAMLPYECRLRAFLPRDARIEGSSYVRDVVIFFSRVSLEGLTRETTKLTARSLCAHECACGRVPLNFHNYFYIFSSIGQNKRVKIFKLQNLERGQITLNFQASDP